MASTHYCLAKRLIFMACTPTREAETEGVPVLLVVSGLGLILTVEYNRPQQIRLKREVGLKILFQ
jgi:hypothetical protein